MIVFSSTLIKAVSVAYHQPQEKMLYTTIYYIMCWIEQLLKLAKPSQAEPDPCGNGGSGKVHIPELWQLQKFCSRGSDIILRNYNINNHNLTL